MIRMHSASRIGERRWNIYLDNGLKIMLPDHDVPSSLRVLADADASMALLSKGIRAVDLRDPARLVVTRAGPPQGAARELMTGSTSKAPQ
jgi:cell division protein FtsQ